MDEELPHKLDYRSDPDPLSSPELLWRSLVVGLSGLVGAGGLFFAVMGSAIYFVDGYAYGASIAGAGLLVGLPMSLYCVFKLRRR